MIELNVAGGVLILAGLAMLIWKREGDRKPNVPSTDILGVKVQGPVGLFVLIVGAACLVLANFQAVKDLVGNKDETAPRPVPVTTGASPAAQPPSNGGNNIFPADLAGTWTGVYEQSNGKSYRVELVITANLATAQVRYPDLGCFGTAIAVSRGGNAIRAQESILNGKCTPTGTLNIELQQNDQLNISYVPDVATYTAHAVLIRRQ